MAWTDKLAELLRLNDGEQAYVGYPQMQVGLTKPRQAGYATGFLEDATGMDSMQPKNPITDPNFEAYEQGKNTGELANIAAMAISPVALTRKEIIAKEIENLSPNAINIAGKEIPVTMHRIEAKEGNQLVNVNTNLFDKAFKNTEWQYIGKNAEGGKPERIAGVEKYLESGKPMNASNVVIKDNGAIVFGDGRHRYAVLRDMGLGKIPMSMDIKSIENAKKHGYID